MFRPLALKFDSQWLRLARWSGLAILILLALAHGAGVSRLRALTQLDLFIGDARLRALMPRTLDPRIVIVDVDEKSLAEVGRWPWGRDRMAALADELFVRQQAAVVGFDMLFAEPDETAGLPLFERLAADDAALAQRLAPLRASFDHDARFARALAGRAAVLGCYFTSDRDARRVGMLPMPVWPADALEGRDIHFVRFDGYAANLAVLARTAPMAGFFNAAADVDGVMRSVPLVAELQGRHYASLALAMFRSYTGEPRVQPGFAPGNGSHAGTLEDIALAQGAQRIAIPVDDRVRVRVPYRGAGGPHGGSFEYVSAGDVLGNRVAPGHLKGKLVLVGSSAPGLYDQAATPVAAVLPGVEVHANLLSGLLDGRMPVQPDWAAGYDIAQMLLASSIVLVLLPRCSAVNGMIMTGLLLLALVGLNLWLYVARHLALPLAAVLLLVLLLYASSTFWAYVVEGHRRRSLARLFGTYVPPELVAEMARDPARYDMRAENRELSVMFCDMRNFTRVSELLAPEDLRALVNRFFSSMTAAIRARRGTLDKYIGDAIMAFWGAPLSDPSHAANAVSAALEMIERMGSLNAELTSRGLPEIGLGIGINTGIVCVGDMGSDIRRSYTVMGDAVNLASRIEALTRHYGVDLLVGEATREAARGAGGESLQWIEVDRVRVKGKQQSVTLFTPVSAAVASRPAFAGQMRAWCLALTAHRLQHWDEAMVHLRNLNACWAGDSLQGLPTRLAERIDHFRSSPPLPGWDGAHTFESK